MYMETDTSGYSVNFDYDFQETHITAVWGLLYFTDDPIRFAYQLVY